MFHMLLQYKQLQHTDTLKMFEMFAKTVLENDSSNTVADLRSGITATNSRIDDTASAGTRGLRTGSQQFNFQPWFICPRILHWHRCQTHNCQRHGNTAAGPLHQSEQLRHVETPTRTLLTAHGEPLPGGSLLGLNSAPES